MHFKIWLKQHYRLILILGLAVIVIAVFFVTPKINNQLNQSKSQSANKAALVNPYQTISVEITPNATIGNLLTSQGLPATVTQAIIEAAKPIYDLAKIRVGRSIILNYDKQSNELKQLVYQTDSEQELYVTKSSIWSAELKPIDYEVRIKKVSGTVSSSLYQAGLDAGIDERAVITLADAFQWNIDFATEPKKGDTFVFVYEERWRDNKYIMPANVLAAKYVNEGTPNYLYYFEEDKDNQGYFDEKGISAQKMFLKAPIAYKYITSGFTTGLRCLERYGLCTGHRATDYAANSGTPIRAVGEGTVIYAGWSSVGYGNLTSIRHNGTYSTNYAHQSKIIVRRGQRVSQGQIIGYVGSTGLSTGPHLHFELVKNGVKVNALKEILPPGKPIKEQNKARFAEVMKKYQTDLQ
ncbi:MAG: peptidoglycan DD-metalloendopeptidase family protein [Candidatus Komeilibacteria bacterium]|nr:peptidoglycan DD-metalloendopeptidase family protein [Candidatus Komeilibacteria bacterium]